MAIDDGGSGSCQYPTDPQYTLDAGYRDGKRQIQGPPGHFPFFDAGGQGNTGDHPHVSPKSWRLQGKGMGDHPVGSQMMKG